MSSQNLSSPVESADSSIPVGAEATRYNSSHHHRPASSRKLFVNQSSENRCHSEGSHIVDGTEPVIWEDVEDQEKNNLVLPKVSCEKLANHVDTMFAKLNEDMKRVAAIYGDGSFFARNFETYDAEVEELGKLNEAEARAQLQRYALRCHVNEKEKEQLHRRNRELNDALEILRVHILRTQTNVLDQARRVAKQATDGLNELLQSSSKEITKLNQKNALSLAQSSSLQNQLKQTTAQLEAKKEALKEANKNLDMLRFERDSLQNHSDQRDQKLEQLESRIHELSEDLKLKEEAVIKAKAELSVRDQEIQVLKEKVKEVETTADACLKRRELEVKRQMDHYLQETKAIDAERERQARAKILEVQRQLKAVQDQRDEAEQRALAAEEKVADYEENFLKYRGQMEGEALRAITSGYRNALSAIPSSRITSSPLDRLFPNRTSSYRENIDPASDPLAKLYTARTSQSRIPPRSETTSSRAQLSRPHRKK